MYIPQVIHLHDQFTMGGKRMHVTQIKNYGGKLYGVQMVWIKDSKGIKEFKFVRWPDGYVYRLRHTFNYARLNLGETNV